MENLKVDQVELILLIKNSIKLSTSDIKEKRRLINYVVDIFNKLEIKKDKWRSYLEKLKNTNVEIERILFEYILKQERGYFRETVQEICEDDETDIKKNGILKSFDNYVKTNGFMNDLELFKETDSYNIIAEKLKKLKILLSHDFEIDKFLENKLIDAVRIHIKYNIDLWEYFIPKTPQEQEEEHDYLVKWIKTDLSKIPKFKNTMMKIFSELDIKYPYNYDEFIKKISKSDATLMNIKRQLGDLVTVNFPTKIRKIISLSEDNAVVGFNTLNVIMENYSTVIDLL
jgi:hypothetical protein